VYHVAIAELLLDLVRDVHAGAQAISTRAGNPDAVPLVPPETLRDRVMMNLLRKD
jgi:hypothetical protein